MTPAESPRCAFPGCQHPTDPFHLVHMCPGVDGVGGHSDRYQRNEGDHAFVPPAEKEAEP